MMHNILYYKIKRHLKLLFLYAHQESYKSAQNFKSYKIIINLI